MKKDLLVETWDIYESKNYDKFIFVNENRDINRASVHKLKESIKNNGYVNANIVKVNKNLEIIDGQHTFMACKELNLPIRYSIFDKLTYEDMKTLNIAGLNWKLKDFIKYNAESGHKSSKILLNKIEEGLKSGVSADKIIYMMFETKSETNIKNTNFEITENQELKFNTRLYNYIRLCNHKDRIVFSGNPNDVVKLFKIIDSTILTNLLLNKIEKDLDLRIDLIKSKSEFDYNKYLTELLSA